MMSSRIVDLPLAYTLRGIPSGARNPRAIKVVDMVPVEIREYSFGDLDLAVRADVEGRRIDIYRVGDFFQASVFAKDTEADMVLEQARAVADLVVRARLHLDAIKGFSSVFDLTYGEAEQAMLHADVGGMRAISRSDETKRRARFWNEVVPRLAIVEGHFVLLGDEPVWEVTQSNQNAVLSFQPSPAPRSYAWRFRLDRRSDALSFCHENFSGLHEKMVEIEIVDDRAWRFDVLDGASDRISYTLLNGILDDELPLLLLQSAPREFFPAFGVLRDGRRSPLEERSEAVRIMASIIDASDDPDAWPSGLRSALSHWRWLEAKALEADAGPDLAHFRI